MLKRKTFEVSTAMLVLDEILHDLYGSYFNQLPKNEYASYPFSIAFSCIQKKIQLPIF